MYDVDRFHAKLTDCLAIGEVAEKKIILMLRAYFRVGNKF